MKGRALALVLVMLLVGGAVGCACKGMVRADMIDDSISQMCEQYNEYLAADETLSESERSTYLRYCVVLEEIIEEAQSQTAGE